MEKRLTVPIAQLPRFLWKHKIWWIFALIILFALFIYIFINADPRLTSSNAFDSKLDNYYF
jgi:hypothetical protein